jgi:hypothetical protein
MMWYNIHKDDFYNMYKLDQDNYQISSCKCFLWSVRANKMMKKSEDNTFMITSTLGNRYKVILRTRIFEKKAFNKNGLIAFVIFFLFALLMFFVYEKRDLFKDCVYVIYNSYNEILQ